MRQRAWLVLLLGALAIGLGIAWIDSRPTWDDTGITAGLVFLSAAAFGVAMPKYAWLWGLCVGGWIPLIEIAQSHNAGSVEALAIALLGAYSGKCLRAMVSPPRGSAG